MTPKSSPVAFLLCLLTLSWSLSAHADGGRSRARSKAKARAHQADADVGEDEDSGEGGGGFGISVNRADAIAAEAKDPNNFTITLTPVTPGRIAIPDPEAKGNVFIIDDNDDKWEPGATALKWFREWLEEQGADANLLNAKRPASAIEQIKNYARKHLRKGPDGRRHIKHLVISGYGAAGSISLGGGGGPDSAGLREGNGVTRMFIRELNAADIEVDKLSLLSYNVGQGVTTRQHVAKQLAYELKGGPEVSTFTDPVQFQQGNGPMIFSGYSVKVQRKDGRK